MKRTNLADLVPALILVSFLLALTFAFTSPAVSGERTLRILYSGDVAGYLEPCG